MHATVTNERQYGDAQQYDANWFLSHALRGHGYTDLADTIVAKSYEAIEKSGYREYYQPYTGEGLGARDFGWSTLILDF